MDIAFQQLLGRVVEVYEGALQESPEARQWLLHRGVGEPSLLERFRVGWSAGALPRMVRGKAARDLGLLGILDEAGQERFRGHVVFPVLDASGQVVQLAAYASDRRLRWLFAETETWWNAAALRSAAEITLVGDPLSGLELIAKGETDVVAPAGPARPLGQGARDALLAAGPRVKLSGCEELRGELEGLGIAVVGSSPARKAEGGEVERQDGGFSVSFPGRLCFEVRGLVQDSPRHLRASVRLHRRPAEGGVPGRSHLDTFDLYHARSRLAFSKTAACLLGEDPIAVEELLSRVVVLSEGEVRSRAEPSPFVAMKEGEREEALDYLRDPRYPERVAEDLEHLGFVGETGNKVMAYLASLSRKLEDPLSILVVSRSAAGKSTLAEAVAALAPPEDVARFTRLTAQTLYYQKPGSLEHKLVVIEEEKGVEDAAYALRILQSARRLLLSTASGKGDARTREVKGPVSLLVTTTRTDLDEETAGRFVTLSVDESREQTRAILAAQRSREAEPRGERERLLRLHQNAQRLLAPVAVVNPHAGRLTFPDDRLSARRDHRKYLGLIRAVAFARQHQRPLVEGAVQVAPGDIALANRLAHQALGQSLYDLAPPSRRLLIEIRDWLSGRDGEARFSQRELRERVGWKKTQLAEHVRELVEAEYLVMHVQGPGRRTRYALDWNGEGLDGERFYRGLVDPGTLGSSGAVPGHDRPSSGSPEGPGSRGKEASSGRGSGEKGS